MTPAPEGRFGSSITGNLKFQDLDNSLINFRIDNLLGLRIEIRVETGIERDVGLYLVRETTPHRDKRRKVFLSYPDLLELPGG